MKFKLTGPLNIDLLSTVLYNRNIENVDELLNPPKVEFNPLQLKNLEEGVNVFIKHVKKKSEIGILIDCDADGYTSSAIFYKYLSALGIRARIFMHNGKIHGLADRDVFKSIEKSGIELLIIPDASSGDFKEHKSLRQLGIEILVVDHHECKEYSKHAIVINNQMCQYPNKELSGVGITYKFIKQVDEQLNIGMDECFMDLVAIGNIADMMDVRSLETRYYIFEGLRNINTELFKKYLSKNQIETPSIIDVAFKIAPELNSIIRMATRDEKRKLFYALVGMDYHVAYKPRGKDETLVHINDDVVRISGSLRSKQRNAVKKAIGEVQDDIERCKDKNILIVKLNSSTPYTLTGLIANKLSKDNNKCCIVLRDSEENIGLCTGSARAFTDINFKDICSKIVNFKSCEGHQGAFGLTIDANKVDETLEDLHNALKDTATDKIYEVDYIIDCKDLKVEDVKLIADLKFLWGGTIPEPMFLIKNIVMPSNNIRLLARSTVGFTHKKINFIKTFAPSNFIDEISCKEHSKFKPINVQLNIICKFVESKYGPQVQIIDFESKPYEEVLW